MKDENQKDRARGTLLGQFAGDSLGALVEFRSAESIFLQEGADGLQELKDGGCWSIMAGQPTDDSEMALALTHTLIKDDGLFNITNIAQAYVDWGRSGPFDIGGTTIRSLGLLNMTLSMMSGNDEILTLLEDKGPQESQANGALMRVSPLGIFASAPRDAFMYGLFDARLTHPNLIPVVASGAFAALLHSLIRTGDREVAFDELKQILEDPSHLLYCMSRHEKKEKEMAIKVVSSWIREARQGMRPNFNHHIGWVRIAFMNAIYQLEYATSAKEGIRETVLKGGDTDTNAAIAGALLGAYYGASTFPDQWVASILNCEPSAAEPRTKHPRPQEYWPNKAFDLADQLLNISSDRYKKKP